MVTRVERYAALCRCCGATTLAAMPEELEPVPRNNESETRLIQIVTR